MHWSTHFFLVGIVGVWKLENDHFLQIICCVLCAMLCLVAPCCALLRHVVLRHVVSCWDMLCLVAPCCVLLCPAVPCCVLLRHTFLNYPTFPPKKYPHYVIHFFAPNSPTFFQILQLPPTVAAAAAVVVVVWWWWCWWWWWWGGG